VPRDNGINAWMIAAGIEDGRLLRSVSKSGKVNRDTLSDWAVWSVVEQSSKQIGIEHFGAHDLRRTCANVWSAALSQAKSDLTGWSAQMYSSIRAKMLSRTNVSLPLLEATLGVGA
jgi:integrase